MGADWGEHSSLILLFTVSAHNNTLKYNRCILQLRNFRIRNFCFLWLQLIECFLAHIFNFNARVVCFKYTHHNLGRFRWYRHLDGIIRDLPIVSNRDLILRKVINIRY